MLFAGLPYDYYVLWAEPQANSVLDLDPRAQYFDIQESHLKFLHASPPLISRMLHILISVGLLGFIMKLYKPSEANKLFDGASLALYMCGIAVYSLNIVKGMRTATGGIYGDRASAENEALFDKVLEQDPNAYFIGREDTLRVIAASNTILAFMLIGILVLQGGQWYAERKEAEEMEELDKVRDEKKAAKTGAASKKKQ